MILTVIPRLTNSQSISLHKLYGFNYISQFKLEIYDSTTYLLHTTALKEGKGVSDAIAVGTLSCRSSEAAKIIRIILFFVDYNISLVQVHFLPM